jgi:hypothetical protein
MPEGQVGTAGTTPVLLDEVRRVSVERLALGDVTKSRHDLHASPIGGVLLLSDRRARPIARDLRAPVPEGRVTELVTEDDPEVVTGEKLGTDEDPVVPVTVASPAEGGRLDDA